MGVKWDENRWYLPLMGFGLLPLALLSLSKCFLSLSIQSSSWMRDNQFWFSIKFMMQAFPWISVDIFSWIDPFPHPKKEGAVRLPGALFGAETFDGSSQGESWGAKSDSVLIGWTGCVMTHRLVAESSRSSPQSPWNSLVQKRSFSTSTAN